MIWIFWLTASYFYAHVYRILHVYAKFNIRGLGWMMRKIGRDLVFSVQGAKFYMYSPIAGSNAMQLIGRWNEPETHLFLHALLDETSFQITFIDVGANIGEMAIDLARNPKVEAVHAFDPVADCIHAIKMGVAANRLTNVSIYHKAVSKEAGTVQFRYDATNPSWSGIAGSGNQVIEVPATTLDTEFPLGVAHPVILLDVEGAENDVLIGAQQLIKQRLPLVIFEYNDVSQKQFDLKKIARTLGDGYEIYRLRQNDGRLDLDFSDTWNCLAVHKDSEFYQKCRALVVS